MLGLDSGRVLCASDGDFIRLPLSVGETVSITAAATKGTNILVSLGDGSEGSLLAFPAGAAPVTQLFTATATQDYLLEITSTGQAVYSLGLTVAAP